MIWGVFYLNQTDITFILYKPLTEFIVIYFNVSNYLRLSSVTHFMFHIWKNPIPRSLFTVICLYEVNAREIFYSERPDHDPRHFILQDSLYPWEHFLTLSY